MANVPPGRSSSSCTRELISTRVDTGTCSNTHTEVTWSNGPSTSSSANVHQEVLEWPAGGRRHPRWRCARAPRSRVHGDHPAPRGWPGSRRRATSCRPRSRHSRSPGRKCAPQLEPRDLPSRETRESGRPSAAAGASGSISPLPRLSPLPLAQCSSGSVRLPYQELEPARPRADQVPHKLVEGAPTTAPRPRGVARSAAVHGLVDLGAPPKTSGAAYANQGTLELVEHRDFQATPGNSARAAGGDLPVAVFGQRPCARGFRPAATRPPRHDQGAPRASRSGGSSTRRSRPSERRELRRWRPTVSSSASWVATGSGKSTLLKCVVRHLPSRRRPAEAWTGDFRAVHRAGRGLQPRTSPAGRQRDPRRRAARASRPRQAHERFDDIVRFAELGEVSSI